VTRPLPPAAAAARLELLEIARAHPDAAERLSRPPEAPTLRESPAERLTAAARLLAGRAAVHADTAAAAAGLRSSVVRRDVPGFGNARVSVAALLDNLKRRVAATAAAARHRGVTINVNHIYKLGLVRATTAARQSCPTDCRFRGDGGCYAEFAQTRRHWDRISAVPLAPVELARREAELIDAARVQLHLPMRLHMAGDCPDSEAAGIVAAAAVRYTAKRGGPVWTYTHAWRAVPRAAWLAVSVLASVETAADAVAARAAGYAPALVVERFERAAAYPLGTTGLRLLPCPAMTKRDVTCSTCRLCFDDRRLHAAGLVIGFEVHGQGAARAAAALTPSRVPLPMAA